MAIVIMGRLNIPNIMCLSSDVSGGKIAGAQPGMVIYYTDTSAWKIVKSDLTLGDYTLPVSINTGDISIGAVELKNATDDTRTKVGAVSGLASSDNGIPTASLLLAGESHIDAVGVNRVIVNATPVLSVHATYVTGDYVGQSAVPITFNSCARVSGGTGTITSAILIDYALQSITGELWLFDTIVTPPGDSAAWTLSDAHAATCLGVIPFSTYYASALNSVSSGVPASPIAFKCGVAVRELYGCFVTRGSPTYASGDLTFRLNISQD
jgi:hypothetical protein